MRLPRRLRRLTRLASLLGTAVGAVACGGDGAIVPARPDPFLYLVLNQRAGGPDPALDQRALLLTVGSPAVSDYRVAERFEMHRARDRVMFAWRDLGRRGQAPVDAANAALLNGNYGLPDAATDGGLGALDIRPGERYDLTVETGGVTIRGSVTVPAAFTLTLERRGTDRVLTWPHVDGADSYSVEIGGVTAAKVQTDTAFTLAPVPAAGAEASVKALDANLSRYVADKRAARAGIDAGYGVFGAISVATLHVASDGTLAARARW